MWERTKMLERLDFTPENIAPSTRATFAHLYHISTANQIQIEKFCHDGIGMIYHPMIASLFANAHIPQLDGSVATYQLWFDNEFRVERSSSVPRQFLPVVASSVSRDRFSTSDIYKNY
jgi:hypothetical protein